ncbi:reverse transcriptase [Colletotrichum camelliae]|nr:reverse transcriptase [Colletotrichum camelliae]
MIQSLISFAVMREVGMLDYVSILGARGGNVPFKGITVDTVPRRQVRGGSSYAGRLASALVVDHNAPAEANHKSFSDEHRARHFTATVRGSPVGLQGYRAQGGKNSDDGVRGIAWGSTEAFASRPGTRRSGGRHSSVSEEFFVNTGIPQGSPISPILFVFFSAPMLEKFERLHPDLNIFAFSYVDDSYILITSREFKENCEILEKYHEQVLEWATPNGIRFDPGKYKVMHFTRNEKCDLHPRISGLAVKHVIDNSVDPEAPKFLRILGVMVDPALKWDAHIANSEEEVALHRIATAHRVRNTDTLEGERMLKVARRRFHLMRSTGCFDVHPYWVAYQQAGFVRDEIVQHYGLERSIRTGRNVAGWFNQYLRQQGVLRSAYLWAEFAEKHALKAPRTCGYEAVTYMGEWCTNIMSIHLGKTRAQSTILLHMRTGHNGLNANLYSINRADTNMCPCGEGEHTVEHLLFDCVSLARQRRELLPANYGKCDDGLRRLKLRYLLTQCAGPVSAWALKHFELEQFSWTKEHLPIRTRAFPFSSGPRHHRV